MWNAFTEKYKGYNTSKNVSVVGEIKETACKYGSPVILELMPKVLKNQPYPDWLKIANIIFVFAVGSIQVIPVVIKL